MSAEYIPVSLTGSAVEPRMRTVRVQKAVDAPQNRDSILSEALRAYLIERRRALLTELKELNKLLGLTTE